MARNFSKYVSRRRFEEGLYVIVEVPAKSPAGIACDITLQQEGTDWRSAGYRDMLYRIDPARPEIKQLRHVHITHAKHRNAKRRQVSWKTDGTRHDRTSFDQNFKPLDVAKEIARKALQLPPDAHLEHTKPEHAILLESAEDGPLPQDAVFLRLTM